jgi:hypothetical protein
VRFAHRRVDAMGNKPRHNYRDTSAEIN